MGDIKNLKVLNLKHNRFVELPRILYTLTKIQVIGLHFISSWSPHIDNIPYHILNIHLILSYMFAYHMHIHHMLKHDFPMVTYGDHL